MLALRSAMGTDGSISSEDVIAKLKDDGDFDRLRLQIIRKLKDSEDLRGNIVSMVKQSAALNQPNAENMKPRQLSDAIYGEIGNEVKSKISDVLWEIIQSGDGMKNEISETVQSVYSKLLNPKGKEEAGSFLPQNTITMQNMAENSGSVTVSTREVDEILPDNEPKEPPGFSVIDHHHGSIVEVNHKEELQLPLPNEGELVMKQTEGPRPLEDGMNAGNADSNEAHGFLPGVGRQQCGISDDDLDVPPGFG